MKDNEKLEGDLIAMFSKMKIGMIVELNMATTVKTYA